MHFEIKKNIYRIIDIYRYLESDIRYRYNCKSNFIECPIFRYFGVIEHSYFRAFWDKDWIPIISTKQACYRALAEYYQSLMCKSNKAIGHEIARLEYSVKLFKSAETRCP